MSMMRRAAYAAGMMIRETGQALDRAGCQLQGRYAYKEQLSRHRQIMNLETDKPIISRDVFLAPNASVIGNVEIGSSSSVWYGAVIRGDTAPIEVGERSVIGDRAVIRGGTRVSSGAYVGAGCVIDGADLGSGVVIGAGSVISPGTRIGARSVVRPGSYVAAGVTIGVDEVWAGSPASKVESLSESERADHVKTAEQTGVLAAAHAAECGKTHEQIEAEALRQELMDGRNDDYNSHVGILGMEKEVIEGQAQLIETEREEQRKAGAA